MVGKYARTNKGDIFIYANVVDEKGNKLDYIMKLVNGGPIKYYLNKDEKIVKHSFNIIDLIEVGDYVNGFEVIETDTGHEVDSQIVVSTPTYKEVYLLEQDIETILTKEQYESNCYTVERVKDGN